MNDTEALRATQKRLADDMRALIRDTEEVLRHKVADAGEGYQEAKSRLEKSLVSARTELSHMESALLDKTREAARSADSYVRHHPWESIGVGAGIGLLIGLLIARK
jgi:ElaB/YqjD/DUF883 family membrane-anchored ribosome-binding protein